MTEAKLQKVLQLSERLKAEEALPRVKVSEASKALVAYIKATPDPLVTPERPEFADNPYTKTKKSGCNIL
ncbi:hypothetical protein HDU93_004893 [Gonapodya sp. JEL0774]|nr:hypothetical protein HDU93_004893 [Gonapodya sp. JEL0774]